MRARLEDQLEALFEVVDDLQVPVGRDEVVDESPRVILDHTAARRRGSPRPVWVVGIAAVLALVVAAIAPLLSGVARDRSPATIPPPDASSGASDITSLGVLTWTKVEGEAEDVPMSVALDPSGGYLSFAHPHVWHSDDALTWRREDVHPDLASYSRVELDGDWALAWVDDSEAMPSVLRQVEGGWEAVERAEPGLPDVVGVRWAPFTDHGGIVSSSGITLIAVASSAEIPWEDHYGMLEWDCGEPDPCVDPPLSEWDEGSQTLRLVAPDSLMAWEEQPAVAELVVSRRGDVVAFTDAETGELVHQIVAAPDYPAEAIIRGIEETGVPPAFQGVWVAAADDGLEFHAVPWAGTHDLVSVPAGGFAAYAYQWDPSAQRTTHAEGWTSPDGVMWVGDGSPGFVPEGADVGHIAVELAAGRLIAEIDTDGRVQRWTSMDGISWAPFDAVFPLSTEIARAEFGYLAAALPQGRWMLWVSADGETWEAIEPPPGVHTPRGAGYSSAGVAGDVVWVAIGDTESGTRTLWIGRFE